MYNLNSNYPLGAENDPNAPYNEPTTQSIEIDVAVNINITKVFTITTDNYYITSDGKYVYDEGSIIEDICRTHYMPYDLENVIMTPNEKLKEDISGWELDDKYIEIL